MSWIVQNAADYKDQVVDNGQCVRFLQVAGHLPHTSTWRRGALVKGNGTPPGTAIATFDPGGTYGNHTDSRSHAAVLDRAQCLFGRSGTGPHPHPATHVSILEWVAGWGCGPVPDLETRRMARFQTDSQKNGLMVWDQWVGQPVHRHLIKFRDGQGSAVNDGDPFYVIEPA